MLYAIIWEDADDSLPRRKAVRPQHLARARALVEQGCLLVAGPFPRVAATEPGPAGYEVRP